MANVLADAVVRLQVDNKALKAGLTKSQEQINKLVKKSESSFGGLGKALKRLGPIIAATFGARELVRFASNVQKTSAAFQQSMANVKAITKATGKSFQDMTAIAQKMGETTQFTAIESAEALKFLGMAGLTTTESIEALPGILDLAAAGSLDLATAADLATNVLGGMNLEVDQLGRVNDVMANTASSANTNIQELAGALRIAGPVAAATGTSIEEVAAILGGLANQGIKAETAGQAVKQMFSRLITAANSGSDALDENGESVGKAQDALHKYGISLKDADGAMRPFISILKDMKDKNIDAAAAQDIFGRFTFSSALAAKSAADEIGKLAKENDRAAGSAKRMAETKLDTFTGDTIILASAWEGLQIAMGNTFVQGDAGRAIIRALTDIISMMTGGVKDSAGSWTDILIPALEISALAFADLAKVMNGIITTFKLVIQGISLLMTVIIQGLVGAFEGAILVVATFLKIISKIPGVGNVFVGVTNTVNTFQRKVADVNKGLEDAAKKAAQSIIDTGDEAAKTSADITKITDNFFANIIGARNRDKDNAADVNKQKETNEKSTLKKIVVLNEDAVEDIGELSEELVEVSKKTNKERIKDFKEWGRTVKETAQKAFDDIQSIISSVFDFGNFLVGLPEQLKKMISKLDAGAAFVDSIADALPELMDKFATAFIDNIDAIVDSFIKVAIIFIDKVIQLLPKIIPKLINVAFKFINALILKLPDIIKAFVEAIPLIIQGFVDNLPAFIDAIIEATPEIIQAMIESVPALILALSEAGPKILLKMIEKIPDFIAALAEGMWDAFKDIPGKIWEEIKKNIQGVGDAIGDGVDKAVEEGKKFINTITGGRTRFPENGGGGKDPVAVNTQQITQAITTAMNAAVGVLVDGINNASSIFLSIIDKFTSGFRQAADSFASGFAQTTDMFLSSMSMGAQVFAEEFKNIMVPAMVEIADAFVLVIAKQMKDIADGLGQMAFDFLNIIRENMPKIPGGGGGSGGLTGFTTGFKAEGGMIGGQSNGRSGFAGDTIPIMATPGEMMIQKSSVNSDTMGELNHINETGRTSGGGGGSTINITVQGSLIRESDMMDDIEVELKRRLDLDHA